MVTKKKFALFRVWDTHPIDQSIVRVFAQHFPEYTQQVFTIMDFLRAGKDVLAVNFLHVARDYGKRILRRELSLKQAFLRTPYIFGQVNAYAQAMTREFGPFAFSFQLQSLFNTATHQTPHFVYTDHTHLENLNYPFFSKKQLYAPAWIACERQLYQQATRIFTRSTNISRSLIEQYNCPAAQVTCVYGGSNIPTETAPRARRREFSKNILFVGIDWERKGGPDLLQAFEIVLQHHPEAHLTIVGAQPPGQHPQITVVGRVRPEEMPHYYHQADIFCVPTRLEPFGAVFIEALAYRLPIVATNIGAIPDFVIPGKNGVLIPPGDVAALARALKTLLDQPELGPQFGATGYELYTQRYNWEAVGKRLRQHILAELTGE